MNLCMHNKMSLTQTEHILYFKYIIKKNEPLNETNKKMITNLTSEWKEEYLGNNTFDNIHLRKLKEDRRKKKNTH